MAAAAPNAPPAILPRILDSNMRFQPSELNNPAFLLIKFSAFKLIASCAPSVKPSSAIDSGIAAVILRSKLGSMPDFSNTFSTKPILAGLVNLFMIAAGNAESNAELTELNNKAALGSN